MFVMRSTYDALQRECDAWAERCERERERHATAIIDSAKRYETLLARYDAASRESARVASLEQEVANWRESVKTHDTRYEALLERYHALRLQGATVRPDAALVALPPADDASRVMAAQRSMAIDSAAADFRARGMSADTALAEAERVIDPLFAHFAGDFQ